MSRSVSDATRFTATSPHAYSKPTPMRSTPSTYTASSSNFQNPYRFPKPANKGSPSNPPPNPSGHGSGPPEETAAEKVARLRAARLKEREAQVTTWDRIVLRGRVWADRAHKVTVYSLVGFSIIAAGVTTFALGDMIMYNRRKRNAFYKEQHALYAKRLIEAIEAESSGQALDEDQTTIMNRERARVQAEEAKAQRSWGKKIKNVFMGGLKMEEGEEEGGVTAEVVGPVPSEGQILEKLGVDQMTVLKQAGRGAVSGGKVDDAESGHGDGSGIIQAVQEERRENERSMEERGAKGGPLDLMAERALRDVSEKVGEKAGWGSWLGWR